MVWLGHETHWDSWAKSDGASKNSKLIGQVQIHSWPCCSGAFWIFWKSHHCVVDSWDLGCFVNSSAWKLFELRTFKASDGHHPVKLVLENMQGGMLESAVTWIAADCCPGVPDPGPGSLAAWPIYHSTVKCKCSISALHCLASFHKFINCFPGDRTRTADACAANKHVLHTSSRRSTPPASLEGVAGDIFFQGYQLLREPLEVRLRDPANGTQIKTVTGTCNAKASFLHVLVILCNINFFFLSAKSDLDFRVGPRCSWGDSGVHQGARTPERAVLWCSLELSEQGVDRGQGQRWLFEAKSKNIFWLGGKLDLESFFN